MGFKEKLKEKRVEANLTQVQLAEKISVTARTIQNYELGTRKPTKYATVEQLAAALNTTAEYLLGQSGMLVLDAQEKGGSKAAKDIEIGITTYPSDDPKVSDYLKPSQFFCVAANSKNADEAVKVINYITNSEKCNDILLGERGVPASAKIAKSIAPKLGETDQTIISFINNVVTPNSTTINPPPPDGSTEVTNEQKQLEEQLCYGKITAAQAAQKLFTDGNQILKSKAK